jgi:hypothetical protein
MVSPSLREEVQGDPHGTAPVNQVAQHANSNDDESVVLPVTKEKAENRESPSSAFIS